jgi:poly(A) polymerase Pap1
MNRTSSKTPSKWYGITPPISSNEPEEKDLADTAKLIETLKKYNQYESSEEAHTR